MNDPMNPEDVLAYIEEGMQVYGPDDEEIGTVRNIFYGSMGTETMSGPIADAKGPVSGDQFDDTGEDSLVENIAEAFAPEDDIPETVRNRLNREGYITVSGSGILSGDYFILPEQVASVSEERVLLRVNSDDLIRR